MTEHFVFTLIAASVGFVSAIFFCIGNAFNTSMKIVRQSTPLWDFSEPVARALTTQRAQYIVGAVFLVATFILQVVASLKSSTNPASLPKWLHSWPHLILTVLISTGLIAGILSWLIYKSTMRTVLRIHKEKKM
jgi:hypothetical protein